MENHVSMVTYVKLANLVKKSEHISLDRHLSDLERVYLAGMADVIKEIAISKFLDEPGTRSTNKKYLESSEKMSGLQHELLASLTEQQKDIFDEIDELNTRCQGFECEEHYINGFMSGYAFLKQIQRSHGGYLEQEGGAFK